MVDLKARLTILVLAISMCMLGACAIQSEKSPEISSSDSVENVEIIPFGEGNFGVLADHEGFAALESFCKLSDNVVVGYYVDSEPVKWNMSRDPADPTQESDYVYTEGVLYEFVVVDTLKGDCVPGESITINIEHGIRTTNGDKVKLYESEVYYEPQFEELVVLGLDHDIYYYAAGYPFEMRFEKPILKKTVNRDFDMSDFYKKSLVVIRPEDFHSANASKSPASKGFGTEGKIKVSDLLKELE